MFMKNSEEKLLSNDHLPEGGETHNEESGQVDHESNSYPSKILIGGVELDLHYSDNVRFAETRRVYSSQITPEFIEAMKEVDFEHFPPSGYKLHISVGEVASSARNYQEFLRCIEITRKRDSWERFLKEHHSDPMPREYEDVGTPLPDLPSPEVYEPETQSMAYPGYGRHSYYVGWGRHDDVEGSGYFPIEIAWFRDLRKAEETINDAKVAVKEYDGELCQERIKTLLGPYGDVIMRGGLLKNDRELLNEISVIDSNQVREPKNINLMVESARRLEKLFPEFLEAVKRKATFDQDRQEKLSRGEILVDFIPSKHEYTKAWVILPDGTERLSSQKKLSRYGKSIDYWSIVRAEEFALAWDDKKKMLVDVKLPVSGLTPEQEKVREKYAKIYSS